jgi:transglutaminase-like putative cysteine protease
MKYRITHVTTYTYAAEVSVSHHLLHLRPRDLPRQRVDCFDLVVQPEPSVQTRRVDYFGNHADVITVEAAHRQLEVVAGSRVEVFPALSRAGVGSPPWETVANVCLGEFWSDGAEAGEFRFDSPNVRRSEVALAYAKPSFPAGRPWLEAVSDLSSRIHREFQFDPKATSVATPVEDVLKGRKGVCQDFAHLMLACLRSLGLPGRYVSGYLETLPPPGRARLVGADASHAWVSAWCPGLGWLDFDPTNDIEPGERHVTLGWGRDFSDVSPIRGVLVGSGEHTLRVSVDVEPQGTEVPRGPAGQSQSQSQSQG